MKLEFDFEDGAPIPKTLDRILSGLLPHKNFEVARSTTVLTTLFTYIELEEMKLQYYIIASLLQKYRTIQMVDTTFVPALYLSDLKNYLSGQLFDIVTDPRLGLEEWLRRNVLPTDLTVQLNREKAAASLYELTVDKYEELFNMEIPTMESQSALVALKEVILTEVARSSIMVEHEILTSGVFIDRHYYNGGAGVFEYKKRVAVELESRLENQDADILHIKSQEDGDRLWSQFKESMTSMASTRIKPMDESMPLVKNRLWVFVGPESVGKTALSMTLASSMVTAEIPTCMIYTESTEVVAYRRFMSAHLSSTYNMKLTSEHLAQTVPVSENHYRQARAVSRMVEDSGMLSLVKAPTYEGLYDKLVEIYRTTGAKFYILDHSMALDGSSGNDAKDISILTAAVLKFKNNFDVVVVVMSHDSSFAKELVAKGRELSTGVTRGSVKLGQAADEVCFIHNTEDMKAGGWRKFQLLKTRGGQENRTYALKLHRTVSHFEYLPELQDLLDKNEVSSSKVLQDVIKKYAPEGENIESFSHFTPTQLLSDEYEVETDDDSHDDDD